MQLQARKNGSLPEPTQCELCLQSTGQMQLHNEDYSNPFDDAHPICRACHGALHIRFSKPERWEKRKATIRELRQASDTESFWREQLTNVPVDINPAHQ